MRVGKQLIAEINATSGCRLSISEEKVLYWMFVSGMLNFRTIRKIILPNMDASNTHRTIRRLVKRGLLENISTAPELPFGWRLALPLQRKFSQAIGYQGCGPYRFVASIEKHNQSTRNLARIISEIIDTEWIAHEPTIRANEMAISPINSFAPTLSVPDLITAINDRGVLFRIAWEVERTMKAGSRLSAILENRATAMRWEKVVYVLEDGLSLNKFVEKSKRVLQTSYQIIRAKHANPILFISQKELEANGINAQGRTATGEIILKDFCKAA